MCPPSHLLSAYGAATSSDFCLEIKHVFPADDRYYSYFIEGDDKEVQSALVDLRQYVESQGPFDAVMAFSQGATLSAIFIALYGNEYFKFAIFICGGVPPKDGGWSAKFTNSQTDGTITIPTGHILGRQDDLYAAGLELSEFCSKSNRLIMEHGGGHEVPKGDKASADMSRLVNDVIARTLFAQ